MRPWARVALACLAFAACGKKEGSEVGAAPGPAASDQPGADTLKGLAVPSLGAGGRADVVPTGPAVVIGAREVGLDGLAVVAVVNGAIDPSELESGRGGRWIGRLRHVAAKHLELALAQGAAWEAVIVAVDPSLPSELALLVARTFRAVEQRRLAFLVRTPEGPGVVPVTVADAAPAVAPPSPSKNPDELPVGMVVVLMPDRVVVWSLTGFEGTLESPRLALQPANDGAWRTKLREDLTDVALRRWGGRERPEEQKTIYVVVDGRVASGDLVAAIAAVRHDAKGNALFPDVQLLTDFEVELGAAAVAPVPDGPRSADEMLAEEAARRRAETRALEAEASRYAALLTAEPGFSEGDLDSRTRPGSDLSAQIDAVRESGMHVRVGGGDRGDAAAAAGAMKDLGDAPKTPPGRIAVAGKTSFDDTSLAADEVLRKVQSMYMAGLKRCYKNELKRDPTLSGGADLAFTVNEAGRTSSIKVKSMTDEFGQCLEGLIANWRFAVPKDPDGEVTDASFSIKLRFTPD